MSATVHVLMSTFNGEAHLEQQIDSIQKQSLPARLFVRDDGSSDNTPRLLEQLIWRGRGEWWRGQNLGVMASYLELLRQCSSNAEYIAFSDQDDVWLPTKLERAVARLQELDLAEPGLYCSRATITNERLQPIGLTPLWPKPPAFGNALVENIATGCTIVLNRPAIDLLATTPLPESAILHDWWCYLVVSAFGKVLFDEVPSLLYRQHTRNVVGVAASPISRTIRKIRRQFRQDTLRLILAQADEFARRYQPLLSHDKVEILSALLTARGSTGAREQLLVETRIFRQHALDDRLLRLRIAVGSWPVPPPSGAVQKGACEKLAANQNSAR